MHCILFLSKPIHYKKKCTSHHFQKRTCMIPCSQHTPNIKRFHTWQPPSSLKSAPTAPMNHKLSCSSALFYLLNYIIGKPNACDLFRKCSHDYFALAPRWIIDTTIFMLCFEVGKEVIFLQLFSWKQNGDILKTKYRYTFTCHVDLFVFNRVSIC